MQSVVLLNQLVCYRPLIHECPIKFDVLLFVFAALRPFNGFAGEVSLQFLTFFNKLLVFVSEFFVDVLQIVDLLSVLIDLFFVLYVELLVLVFELVAFENFRQYFVPHCFQIVPQEFIFVKKKGFHLLKFICSTFVCPTLLIFRDIKLAQLENSHLVLPANIKLINEFIMCIYQLLLEKEDIFLVFLASLTLLPRPT